jgi:molybdopterin synthase sulfur carrier subunit
MQLLFFGSLTDIAGKTEFDVSQIENTDQLKEKLFGKYPELKKHSFLIAVNKKVQTGNCTLKEDDTVALLPPFSGG